MERDQIVALSKFGETGWRYSIKRVELADVQEFRTNGSGNGCWRYEKDGTPKQIRGTSQYSLPATRAAVIRRFERQGYAILDSVVR